MGESLPGHIEESGTRSSLEIWGCGASDSLLPSCGPRLYVGLEMRGTCLDHALVAPGCVSNFFLERLVFVRAVLC